MNTASDVSSGSSSKTKQHIILNYWLEAIENQDDLIGTIHEYALESPTMCALHEEA